LSFEIQLCFHSDLRALARAAVEGDERALDMFTWTPGKGPSGKSFSFGPQEGSTFFIGGQNGKYCLPMVLLCFMLTH